LPHFIRCSIEKSATNHRCGSCRCRHSAELSNRPPSSSHR
jgi:hypothetical protein